MLYSIVAVLVVILDQAVKNWVSGTLFGTDVVRFIPGVVSLVNVHNDGAAFSFLSGGGARIYFIVITGIFTVAVIIALATNFISGRLSRWSLVLVTAGGLSNCLDRIIYGYVQDMFKVELFDFAIFNVADIFITVFAVVFALAMIFERQEDDEEDEYYDEDEDEEEKPGKKKGGSSLLSRFKRDDSLDEDDEPDRGRRGEDPRRKKASRRSKYEDEYEQYKAEREARQQAEKRGKVKSEPAAAQADPFAEWERANAAVESRRGSSAAAKAMGATPRPAAEPVVPSVTPRQSPRPAPAKPVQPAPQSAVRIPAEPVLPTEPVAPPKPKPVQPKTGGASSDFDLDDILAEFK